VSTLQERLREVAEEHQRQQDAAASAKVARQEAAESRRSVLRMRHVAQEYLETAAALRAATRPHVHHDVRCSATEQGFTLEIGGRTALQANLESDVWHVTIWNRLATIVQHTYESDSTLLGARDELLEPLAATHLEAFASGKEQPADDRERGTSSFNFTASPWSRDRSVLGALRSAAPRQVKLVIYVIAFGTGLVLGTLLVRHAPHAPTLSREVRQEVFRPAVAPIFPGVPPHRSDRRARSTSPAPVSRPPALRATRSVSIPAHPARIPQSSRLVAQAGPKTAISEGARSSLFVIAPSDAPAGMGASLQAAGQTPRFHVQVGVFNARKDAQALIQQLKSLGYTVSLGEDDVYRVWVGGYFDRETAERLAANLRNAGFDAVLEP
jgi:cell division septation protein DedD